MGLTLSRNQPEEVIPQIFCQTLTQRVFDPFHENTFSTGWLNKIMTLTRFSGDTVKRHLAVQIAQG